MMNKGDVRTKIFIDGGDSGETRKAKEALGWLDGQTTNPSLIANNLKARGEKLTQDTALEEYRRIVTEMSGVVPDGSVSIQVFANSETPAEEMVKQARERVKWIPNASIKLPCVLEGLKAGEILTVEMPLNFTLVFSQAQAAAVYEVTRGTSNPVFLSPFVGRLDDRGEAGMDIVANILKMYAAGDDHVEILVASIRNFGHLLYTLYLEADIATLPFEKVFLQWDAHGFTVPGDEYEYNRGDLKPIEYDSSVALGKHWGEYDLNHELTEKGLASFWEDWMGLFG